VTLMPGQFFLKLLETKTNHPDQIGQNPIPHQGVMIKQRQHVFLWYFQNRTGPGDAVGGQHHFKRRHKTGPAQDSFFIIIRYKGRNGIFIGRGPVAGKLKPQVHPAIGHDSQMIGRIRLFK